MSSARELDELDHLSRQGDLYGYGVIGLLILSGTACLYDEFIAGGLITLVLAIFFGVWRHYEEAFNALAEHIEDEIIHRLQDSQTGNSREVP